MANIIINNTDKAIEITKGFDHKARVYGSDEYKQLLEVRNTFPGYEVVVKVRKTGSKDSMKGLNYRFMKTYIETHVKECSYVDAKGKEIRTTTKDLYDELTRKYEGENPNMPSIKTHYGQVKKWFLAQYPEVNRIKAYSQILKSTKLSTTEETANAEKAS